ncbi:uncharacterized protein LOC133904523 [Phragmites australis]|uniref:uncharacterized protein LOC133904523 n=1 Tax=Phragmites australis TaxID=29695 RepID=UPI002D777A29|nr:uncharacterized protein LOC133904523 [Phragmites australis]
MNTPEGTRTEATLQHGHPSTGPVDDGSDSDIWEPDDPQSNLDDNQSFLYAFFFSEHVDTDNVIPDDYVDEEGRLFAGLDVEFSSYKVTSAEVGVGKQFHDPYDHIYKNLPKNHHVLREVANCDYFQAKWFQFEGVAFCCRKGKTFKSVGVVPNLDEYRIELNTDISLNQRSIKAVKYLFKYIYKGNDHASFSVDHTDNNGAVVNEIKQYRDARFITPPEAVYKIFGFPLYDVYPSVLQLQLHLPNMHMVAYKATANLNDVVNQEKSKRSMLTKYFHMNRVYLFAWQFLYKEFPEHFRWLKSTKNWIERKQRPHVGRIIYANPAKGERYYLRVLLNHVRGATSYENLQTVWGVTYSTFRETCEIIGLVETDKSLDDCLIESATFQMSCALRRLFATIMVFYEVTNIRALWDKHFESMSKDYRRAHTNAATIEKMILRDIRNVVHSMGKDIRSFGLPELDETDNCSGENAREVIEEQSVGVDQEHLNIIRCMGKTYLYKALLARVHSLDLISGTAELLHRASLIIWDEVAMTKRQTVEALDRIGNGTEESIGDDYVRLLNDIVISYNTTKPDESVDELIQNVFPYLHNNATLATYMSSRAMLVTKNEHVDELNARMVDRFLGKEKGCVKEDDLDSDEA